MKNQKAKKMSVKFLFSSLVVATSALLSPAVGSAMPIDFPAFTGTYSLVANERGACPQNLRIVQNDFLNQLAEHSLTFSGVDSKGSPVLIYDMIALNAGPVYKKIPNPMLGGYVGREYRNEQLQPGRIKAVKRFRNMFGILGSEDQIDATFKGDSLSYRYSTFNTNVYPIVNRTDICHFKKNVE